MPMTGMQLSSLAALLHHSGILFLEALVQAGGSLELFVDAAQDTLLFAVDEGLGGEIVDTVVEAALDHLRVHLWYVRYGNEGGV